MADPEDLALAVVGVGSQSRLAWELNYFSFMGNSGTNVVKMVKSTPFTGSNPQSKTPGSAPVKSSDMKICISDRCTVSQSQGLTAACDCSTPWTFSVNFSYTIHT